MNATTYQEIHRTDKGAVYQCDATRRFILEFWGTQTAFSVRDFFAFKRMVDTVDLRQMALHTDDAYDVEILTAPCTDRCYVLTLCEVVQLRELLNGAKAMLDLNTLLRERGCCFAN